MEEKRERWGSKFGFFASAVGAAIGLGNIWGFPYRMGENGGFAFLVIYAVLTAAVGIPMLAAELAIGRMTRQGADGAFRTLSRRFKYTGLAAVAASFLVMGFYNALGGCCLKYTVINAAALLGVGGTGSAEGLFRDFACSPAALAAYSAAFAIAVTAVVSLGVVGGIEKFSKVAMPALTLLLCAAAVRALMLPGAMEGLRFMFAPNLRPLKSEPMKVLMTAGEQMFFSLSVGMGCMVTYGAYLPRGEKLLRAAAVIAIADAVTALIAGVAVLPAAFALGGDGAEMTGPALLFITMQRVFGEMGRAGALFGTLFYALATAAAVTSGVSFVEVTASFLTERSGGRIRRRPAVLISGAAAFAVTLLCISDGLGYRAGDSPFGRSWLEAVDIAAEGVLIPLASLATALMAGYELRPERIERELELYSPDRRRALFRISLRVLCPAVMLMIIAAQVLGVL